MDNTNEFEDRLSSSKDFNLVRIQHDSEVSIVYEQVENDPDTIPDEPTCQKFPLVDAHEYLNLARINRLELIDCTFSSSFLDYFLKVFKDECISVKKLCIIRCWFPAGSSKMENLLSSIAAEQWNFKESINTYDNDFWNHNIIRESSCLRLDVSVEISDNQLARLQAKIIVLKKAHNISSAGLNILLKAFIEGSRSIQYYSIKGLSRRLHTKLILDGIEHKKLSNSSRRFIVQNKKGHKLAIHVLQYSFLCYKESK